MRLLAYRTTKAKYATFAHFFDARGAYKLAPMLEDAYKAATPNQFQKDFIETDRKVNLLFSALEGKVLRIFPIPNDVNNKWVSLQEVPEINFEGVDSLYVNNVLPCILVLYDKAKVHKTTLRRISCWRVLKDTNKNTELLSYHRPNKLKPNCCTTNTTYLNVCLVGICMWVRLCFLYLLHRSFTMCQHYVGL